jgi:hypothetical protein
VSVSVPTSIPSRDQGRSDWAQSVAVDAERAKLTVDLFAPSAALQGVQNVTLFGRRALGAWGVEPLLASVIPGCVVARGRPCRELLTRARYRGDQHLGYRAYLDMIYAEGQVGEAHAGATGAPPDESIGAEMEEPPPAEEPLE